MEEKKIMLEGLSPLALHTFGLNTPNQLVIGYLSLVSVVN